MRHYLLLAISLILAIVLVPPGPLTPGHMTGKYVGTTTGKIGKDITLRSITVKAKNGKHFSCSVGVNPTWAAKQKGDVACVYAREIKRRTKR